jgi:putative transposase
MGLEKLPKTEHVLIHHSDHGIQYTCRAYMDALLQNGIFPSMGEVGNCYDNIFAERVIGTLKNEYCLDVRFSDHNQVYRAVVEAIDCYNTDRPHLSLNMAVPWDVYSGGIQDVAPLLISVGEKCIT